MQVAADTIKAIADNSNILIPVLAGLVGAFAAFQAVQFVTTFLTEVSTAIAAIQGVMTAMSMIQSFQGLIAVLSTLAGGPVVLVVMGIATLAAGLIALWNTNEGFRNAVTSAWNFIQQVATTVFGAIANFFTVMIPGAILTVLSFFASLPANIGTFLTQAVAFVRNFVANLASGAIQAGSRFVSGLIGFISRIPSTISGFLTGAINVVSGFVGSLATHAMNAGQRFLSGIQNGFNSAISFVRGIPSRILGALGNVGSLLTSAGKSIIDGFLSGLKSSFDGVKNFVGGIGNWIASHKGPIEYDRKLLIPNGKAVMQSLRTGLAAGFTSDVMPYVSDMAGHIQGALTPSPMSVAMDAALDAQGAQDNAYSAATARLEETLIRLFETRLGAIIEANAPYMTVREARRMLA